MRRPQNRAAPRSAGTTCLPNQPIHALSTMSEQTMKRDHGPILPAKWWPRGLVLPKELSTAYSHCHKYVRYNNERSVDLHISVAIPAM